MLPCWILTSTTWVLPVSPIKTPHKTPSTGNITRIFITFIILLLATQKRYLRLTKVGIKHTAMKTKQFTLLFTLALVFAVGTIQSCKKPGDTTAIITVLDNND